MPKRISFNAVLDQNIEKMLRRGLLPQALPCYFPPSDTRTVSRNPSICQPCVVKEQDKKREPTNAKQSRGRITMDGVVIVKGK